MKKLELKEITIESPLSELKIGDEYHFKGTDFKLGYQEGFSKIKSFYKIVPFWDDEPSAPKKDGSNNFPVFMILENEKEILLGFMEYGEKFRKKFGL
jgi:hypothetical protein